VIQAVIQCWSPYQNFPRWERCAVSLNPHMKPAAPRLPPFWLAGRQLLHGCLWSRTRPTRSWHASRRGSIVRGAESGLQARRERSRRACQPVRVEASSRRWHRVQAVTVGGTPPTPRFLSCMTDCPPSLRGAVLGFDFRASDSMQPNQPMQADGHSGISQSPACVRELAPDVGVDRIENRPHRPGQLAQESAPGVSAEAVIHGSHPASCRARKLISRAAIC
jgi:hypothetical protein